MIHNVNLIISMAAGDLASQGAAPRRSGSFLSHTLMTFPSALDMDPSNTETLSISRSLSSFASKSFRNLCFRLKIQTSLCIAMELIVREVPYPPPSNPPTHPRLESLAFAYVAGEAEFSHVVQHLLRISVFHVSVSIPEIRNTVTHLHFLSERYMNWLRNVIGDEKEDHIRMSELLQD